MSDQIDPFCRREFEPRSRASAKAVPVGTVKPKTEGFGSNSPGPKGFPLAGARGVGLLGRCTTSTFATLLADRLAIGETELVQSDRTLL